MSRRNDRGSRPYVRSETKILEVLKKSVESTKPVDETYGFDVSEWLCVRICFHPVSPDINHGSLANGYVKVRPWRYRKTATEGLEHPTGVWFADTNFTFPLDGVTTTYPMEQSFNTAGAEKVHLQVIEVYDPGTDNPTYKFTVYGIGPRYSEDPDAFESVSVSAAAAAAAAAGSNVNLTGINGTAPSVNAGAGDLGTLRVIYASNSPGIGAHDAATAAAGFRALWVARSAAQTAVAAGDDVHPVANVNGELVVAGYDWATGKINIQGTFASSGVGNHDAATATEGIRSLFVATTADPAAVANQDDVHPICTTTGYQIIAGYSRTNDDVKVELTSNSVGLGVHDTATANAGMRALHVARSDSTVVVNPGDDVHPSANVAGETVLAGYNWVSGGIKVELIQSSLGLGLHDVATADSGMRALYVARTSAAAAVANGDDVHPVANTSGEAIIAGYDWATGMVAVQLSTASGVGAHDAATANAGLRSLGVAQTTDPAAVAAGDDVHLTTTTTGKLVVAGYNWTNSDIAVELTTNSAGYGAHDAATAVGGLRSLFVGTNADPAAVANGDDVHPIATLYGYQIIAGYDRTNDVVKVSMGTASGIGAHDSATANAGFRGLAVATSSDLADVSASDDVHLVATLDGKLIIAGYDRLTNANRVEEVDPLSMQFAEDKVSETNVGTATYTYYFDMSGFGHLAWQYQLTVGAATVYDLKVYVTVEADDPDLSARTYVDVTNAFYGSATITAAGFFGDTGLFVGTTAVKFEISLTNASNNSSWDIDVKRVALA